MVKSISAALHSFIKTLLWHITPLKKYFNSCERLDIALSHIDFDPFAINKRCIGSKYAQQGMNFCTLSAKKFTNNSTF